MREVGRAAAVGAGAQARFVELARVGDRAFHRALHRRIGIEVVLGRSAQRAREREEAGVFARTVVPQGIAILARARMPSRRGACRSASARRSAAVRRRRRPSRAGARRCRAGRRRRRATRRPAPALRRRSPACRSAPVRQSGSACSGLIAERVNVTSSGSPSAWMMRPSPSTTAAATRCQASMPSPRVTTTVAGGAGARLIAGSYSADAGGAPRARKRFPPVENRGTGLRTLLRAMMGLPRRSHAWLWIWSLRFRCSRARRR